MSLFSYSIVTSDIGNSILLLSSSSSFVFLVGESQVALLSLGVMVLTEKFAFLSDRDIFFVLKKTKNKNETRHQLEPPPELPYLYIRFS